MAARRTKGAPDAPVSEMPAVPAIQQQPEPELGDQLRGLRTAIDTLTPACDEPTHEAVRRLIRYTALSEDEDGRAMAWMLICAAATALAFFLLTRTSSPAVGTFLLAVACVAFFVGLNCVFLLRQTSRTAQQAHQELTARLPPRSMAELMRRIQDRRSTQRLERAQRPPPTEVRDFDTAWQEAKQWRQEDLANRRFP